MMVLPDSEIKPSAAAGSTDESLERAAKDALVARLADFHQSSSPSAGEDGAPPSPPPPEGLVKALRRRLDLVVRAEAA